MALLFVVASGCAGTGGSRPAARLSGVSASGATLAHGAVPTTPASVAPPTAAPTTVATRAAAVAHVAASEVTGPSTPPVPSVAVVALGDGSITRSNDRPCSNISAQSIERGQLEVSRTGATNSELAVQYGVTGVDADHEPLPGQITIPAGAASAVIMVDPRMSDGPPPVHVHRSSSLTVALADGSAYDLGPTSSAAVTLRFDVDVFGCGKPGGA